MPRRSAEAPPAPFGLDRLVFFSDAVIAIAITLLVLDLRVPEVAVELAADPSRALVELPPKVVGFFVSFWVIALYWVAHHRSFRYVRRYDRQRLNLLLPPVIFLLSAAMALVSPDVAMYLWLLIPVYVRRRHREVTVLGD